MVLKNPMGTKEGIYMADFFFLISARVYSLNSIKHLHDTNHLDILV
jgi:hypothetical protein